MDFDNLHDATREIQEVFDKHGLVGVVIMLDIQTRSVGRAMNLCHPETLIVKDDGVHNLDNAFINRLRDPRAYDFTDRDITRMVNTVMTVDNLRDETVAALDLLIEMGVHLNIIRRIAR